MSIIYQEIDDFKKILLINNEEEMDSIISKNFSKIKTILNNILGKLNKKFILKTEIYDFVNILKFIDNLNLFFDDEMFDEISKFMKEIKAKINSIKRLDYETKKYVFDTIKYTELTYITYKKEYYKKLFFNYPNKIIKAIENDLNKVNKYGNFDDDLFQQIQNLYWILKNKIDNENDRNYLDNKIKKMKKFKNNYYDDYNYDYDKYNNTNYYDKYNNIYYNNSYQYKNYYNNYGETKNGEFYNNKKNYKNNYNYYNNNKQNNKNLEQQKHEENKNIINKNNNENKNNDINYNKDTNEKLDINIKNEVHINDNINEEKNSINDNIILSSQNFSEIKNIEKININEEITNEENIENNKIFLDNKIYNIMNNIYDYYSNYYFFNSVLKSIKQENIEENNINFKITYHENESSEIENYYKNFLIDYKEAKLKEKIYIQQKNENKEQILKNINLNLNINDNNEIINKKLLKLNIPQIIKKALEELEEESKNNLNKIDNNEKNNLKNINNFSFDNLLKIYQEDYQVEYERINKINNTRKNSFDSDDSNEESKEEINKIDISNKDYIFYTDNILKCNSIIISKNLSNLIEEYKQNQSDIKNSLSNFFFSNCKKFDLKDENYKNYLAYKTIIYQNSNYSSINLKIFEKYILLPLYHKIIAEASKKIKIFDKILKKYTKIIKKACDGKDVIEDISPYGSFANNLLDKEGDIDICIVPTCPWFKFRRYAYKIKNRIENYKIGTIKLFHISKSFYLISVYDEETKTNLDITIHNLLPILNSKLIKLYSEYDQRFHIMGIYIKYWSKLNKVHGAANQYLSSYTLILMLIYFLQKIVQPRILPDLQNIPINDDFTKPEYKENDYDYYYGHKKMTTNIHYEEDIEKINKYMNYINNGEKNNESVSNLLVKFFEYYAYFYDNNKIISIKSESDKTLNKKAKNGFSIEDPFESKHKPGKSMKKNSPQYNKFVNCMKKEINNILSGEYIKRFSKSIVS